MSREPDPTSGESSDRHQSTDRVEALLRDALHTEAAMVDPAGDGLSKIQARTARGRSWWRTAGLAVAGAASVGLLTGGILSIARSGDVETVAPTGPTPTATASVGQPTSASPTPSAPASPTPSASASRAPSTPQASPTGEPAASPPVPPPPLPVAAALGIYYAGSQPSGSTRLYREFHKVVIGPSRGAAAVTHLLTTPAADRDYRSLLTAGTTLRSYRQSAATATVDLSMAPPSSLATQQLVYTVTAAENSVSRVRLLVNGATRGTYERAPRVETEAAVWITSPYDGAEVGRTVTIEGIASVFEATVSYQLLKGGVVVKSGSVTAAEAAPTRAKWTLRLTLAPGGYEVRALDRSAEDGRVLSQDTKRFTVG